VRPGEDATQGEGEDATQGEGEDAIGPGANSSG